MPSAVPETRPHTELIELVRPGYEAYNEHGLEALLHRLHPAVEWRSPFPENEVFRGHDGVREWFRRIEHVYFEVHFEPLRMLPEGRGRITVLHRARARLRATGAAIEALMAHRWTLGAGPDKRAVVLELVADGEQVAWCSRGYPLSASASGSSLREAISSFV